MRVDKGLSKERIRMSLASSRSLGDRSLGQHRNPVRVAVGSTGSIGCKVSLVLLCLLGFFVLLHSLLPLRTTIQIGADEGFELAKITLSLKGYKFYTEVWNDQPLLHTFLTTQVYKYLFSSVLGPRLVTSAFAVLLLTSVFFLSLRIGGLLIAVVATTLLIASPGFLELSSSCMVEIPALAPAVGALCLLLVGHQTKWHVAEILAGALFAAALQIKFIGAVYLPLVALTLWLRGWDIRPNAVVSDSRVKSAGAIVRSSPIKGIAAPLVFFAVSLATCFVAINYLVSEGSYWLQLKQSWSAHFASAKSFEYGSPADHPFGWGIFLKNWDITIPAAFGIIILSRQVRKTPAAIIPLAWIVLTVVVFATHKPWWSYYYVHNAVPLCLCAAAGMEAFRQRVNWRQSPALSVFIALYAICALPWMSTRIYLQAAGIRHSPQTYSSLVLNEIERFKPFSKLIYTDQPVFSFYAGIPMPPNLAIVSLKRLWSGDMTNDRIAAELWNTKPGVILLANDTRALPFDDLLASEYGLVYMDDKHRLYAQKAMIAQTKRQAKAGSPQ
jgi:hypothetical protein